MPLPTVYKCFLFSEIQLIESQSFMNDLFDTVKKPVVKKKKVVARSVSSSTTTTTANANVTTTSATNNSNATVNVASPSPTTKTAPVCFMVYSDVYIGK